MLRPSYPKERALLIKYESLQTFLLCQWKKGEDKLVYKSQVYNPPPKEKKRVSHVLFS